MKIELSEQQFAEYHVNKFNSKLSMLEKIYELQAYVITYSEVLTPEQCDVILDLTDRLNEKLEDDKRLYLL